MDDELNQELIRIQQEYCKKLAALERERKIALLAAWSKYKPGYLIIKPPSPEGSPFRRVV